MAKQSRKARKQEKQKELNEMTQKQYQTILKLKKYAEGIGKKCEFEKIPGSNNIMKYEEEVVNEENVLEYFFMIGVREDGSVFTTCCKDLNVKEDGKETAAPLLRNIESRIPLSPFVFYLVKYTRNPRFLQPFSVFCVLHLAIRAAAHYNVTYYSSLRF